MNIFQKILTHTHMYDTLKKHPDKIKETKIYWRFGKWRNDPCLPVWRRGPIFRIGRKSDSYYPSKSVLIKTGVKEMAYGDKTCNCNVYKRIWHNTPDVTWNRPIRKRLRKYGLGWLKPEYQLPIWLTFKVFNWDVFYKTKWGENRFEYPPQFTIVAFGLSLSFWVRPINPPQNIDDFWWEDILNS